MSHLSFSTALLIVAVIGAGCMTHEAKSNHTTSLCLRPQAWPEIKDAMIAFGPTHNLDFHGQVEHLSAAEGQPERQILNFALIRGLHQFGGDDLDLWLVTNPNVQHAANLNVVSKRELTFTERRTEQELLSVLKPFSCDEPKAAVSQRGV